ncbi:protein of unknown function [Streptomyces sp. KY75]|nr:protein of unknown function [Streptomyces sp. KY75]
MTRQDPFPTGAGERDTGRGAA